MNLSIDLLKVSNWKVIPNDFDTWTGRINNQFNVRLKCDEPPGSGNVTCTGAGRPESHPVMDTPVIIQTISRKWDWELATLSIFEFSRNPKESFIWMIYYMMSLDGGQFSVCCIVAWCTGPDCSIILFIHWVIVSPGPIQSRPPTSLTLTVIRPCYLFMFFQKRWDSEKML